MAEGEAEVAKREQRKADLGCADAAKRPVDGPEKPHLANHGSRAEGRERVADTARTPAVLVHRKVGPGRRQRRRRDELQKYRREQESHARVATQLPKRDVLSLAKLKFLDAKENVLLIGKPGTGKSHIAKALALLAVERGHKVIYREAHVLIQDIHEARQLGESATFRNQLKAAELLIIDDLFLRGLPRVAGEELADVLMSRHEKSSTLLTSNRPIED